MRKILWLKRITFIPQKKSLGSKTLTRHQFVRWQAERHHHRAHEEFHGSVSFLIGAISDVIIAPGLLHYEHIAEALRFL